VHLAFAAKGGWLLLDMLFLGGGLVKFGGLAIDNDEA